MSLLVDTSAWSLALRRDGAQDAPEVMALHTALLGADQVFTTGLVLQQLLQGFAAFETRDSATRPATRCKTRNYSCRER